MVMSTIKFNGGYEQQSEAHRPLLPCSTSTLEVMLLKILKNEMACISCYVTNTKMKHQSQQEVIIIT